MAAEPALSAVDLPPFDRSAMDGYAVRAADTAPGVPLRLVGGVAAGEVATATLEPGTAARVSTGAAIPPGADAILQSELARRARRHRGARARARARHARPLPRRGPARRRRARAGRLGRSRSRASRRSPRRASARSSVHRRPRLHLIVTGSELLPLGAPPEPGRIHESNGLMVRLLAERAGAEVVDHGVIGDDYETTRERGLGRASRATCWSCPAACRSARTTTSSPPSRAAASRRSSGACGSSPASRCGSAAAATRWSSGCPATRCRRSSASACSSSRPCGAWPARPTRARGSSPAA